MLTDEPSDLDRLLVAAANKGVHAHAQLMAAAAAVHDSVEAILAAIRAAKAAQLSTRSILDRLAPLPN